MNEAEEIIKMLTFENFSVLKKDKSSDDIIKNKYYQIFKELIPILLKLFQRNRRGNTSKLIL